MINPAVAFPNDPACGAQGDPCTFDGSGIANSGLHRTPNPRQPASTFTLVSAPVGTYSLLCLLHPGMQTLLEVVPAGRSIPSPGEVRQNERASRRGPRSRTDGPVADALAQRSA